MDSLFKFTIGQQIKMAWISETWSTYSLTMELSDTYEYYADF